VKTSQDLNYYLKVITLYIKVLEKITEIKKDMIYLLIQKENKYVGEWKNDKFNGKGRFFFVQGDY